MVINRKVYIWVNNPHISDVNMNQKDINTFNEITENIAKNRKLGGTIGIAIPLISAGFWQGYESLMNIISQNQSADIMDYVQTAGVVLGTFVFYKIGKLVGSKLFNPSYNPVASSYPTDDLAKNIPQLGAAGLEMVVEKYIGLNTPNLAEKVYRNNIDDLTGTRSLDGIKRTGGRLKRFKNRMLNEIADGYAKQGEITDAIQLYAETENKQMIKKYNNAA